MNNLNNISNIAICELECKNFAHEEINAAIIKLILDNKPNSVNLYCEKNHYEHIKKIYETRLGKKLILKHRSIKPPIGQKFEFLNYYLLLKNLFYEFEKLNIQKVYFTNTHHNCLLSIIHIYPKYPKIDLLMILHGELDVHLKKYSLFKKILNYYFWLGRLIKKASNKIDFYVVSKHIELELKKMGKKDVVTSINHPYLWNTQISNSIKNNQITKICCIGAMHNDKGRKNLTKLIKDLGKTSLKFELSIFGPFKNNIKDPRIKIHNRRFSRQEFDKLIPDYDFALLPYRKNSYSLKASGVFFDALNYETPIITTSNSFTKYFFNLLGKIGFLAKNYEELLNYVIKNIKKRDEVSMLEMKTQIKKSKDILSNSNFIN